MGDRWLRGGEEAAESLPPSGWKRLQMQSQGWRRGGAEASHKAIDIVRTRLWAGTEDLHDWPKNIRQITSNQTQTGISHSSEVCSSTDNARFN